MNNLLQTIKWNVIANKHMSFRFFISITISLLLLALFSANIIWEHSPMEEYRMATSKTCALVCLTLVPLRCAVSTCFNMRTKNDLQNYLMLPATKAEKFLANVIYQCVIMFLIGIAAIIAADLLQMLISLVVCGNSVSFFIMAFYDLNSMFSSRSVTQIAPVIALMVLTHSLFVFGGTFFRKHPLVMTVLTLVTVPLILGIIAASIGSYVVEYLSENDYEVTYEILISKTMAQWLAITGMLLWAAVNYWLSYRIFSRIQIINNKYFNW